MNVLITGGTGFVGSYVVDELLKRGHKVSATARNMVLARSMAWADQVTFFECDVNKDFDILTNLTPKPDALIHLAWAGLPNFKDYFHIDNNLPADLKFLSAMVRAGIKQLIVAGTCLEYGMQNGPLEEDQDTFPTTPYGFAKDALRKSLQLLQKEESFILQWVRLFYMHGKGQNENSLLAQLDRAIANGDDCFNMSAGDQLRDYLAIEDIAKIFCDVLENKDCNGIINCCSGKPVSVLDLVTERCKQKNSTIRLNRYHYPYPDYEPMAFWGVPAKLNKLYKSEKL